MMSKGLSAWFAISSMLLLMATAVSLSHSLWFALLFAVLSVANIGWGFVIKAKKEEHDLSRSQALLCSFC